MSFRRIPKEIDPRRPPKRRRDPDADAEGASEPRSYGQYIEMTPEEVAELERVTGEVAREGVSGGAESTGDSAEQSARRQVEAQEAFEEATDEVSRENGESR